jgi:hypothetical protein
LNTSTTITVAKPNNRIVEVQFILRRELEVWDRNMIVKQMRSFPEFENLVILQVSPGKTFSARIDDLLKLGFHVGLDHQILSNHFG